MSAEARHRAPVRRVPHLLPEMQRPCAPLLTRGLYLGKGQLVSISGRQVTQDVSTGYSGLN
jgi:hypothetical protein